MNADYTLMIRVRPRPLLTQMLTDIVARALTPIAVRAYNEALVRGLKEDSFAYAKRCENSIGAATSIRNSSYLPRADGSGFDLALTDR